MRMPNDEKKDRQYDDKYLWMKFFTCKTKEEFEGLESYNNKFINKAIALLRELSADEDIRREVELQEKSEIDMEKQD